MHSSNPNGSTWWQWSKICRWTVVTVWPWDSYNVKALQCEGSLFMLVYRFVSCRAKTLPFLSSMWECDDGWLWMGVYLPEERNCATTVQWILKHPNQCTQGPLAIEGLLPIRHTYNKTTLSFAFHKPNQEHQLGCLLQLHVCARLNLDWWAGTLVDPTVCPSSYLHFWFLAGKSPGFHPRMAHFMSQPKWVLPLIHVAHEPMIMIDLHLSSNFFCSQEDLKDCKHPKKTLSILLQTQPGLWQRQSGQAGVSGAYITDRLLPPIEANQSKKSSYEISTGPAWTLGIDPLPCPQAPWRFHLPWTWCFQGWNHLAETEDRTSLRDCVAPLLCTIYGLSMLRMMRMAAPSGMHMKWNEQAFSEVRSVLCSCPKLRYQHVCHCLLCHPLCLHMRSGTTQPNQFSSCLEAAQGIFSSHTARLLLRKGQGHCHTWKQPSSSSVFSCSMKQERSGANLRNLLSSGQTFFEIFAGKFQHRFQIPCQWFPPEVSTMIRVENPQVHPSAWHDARQSQPIVIEMKKQSWNGHETPCGTKHFGGWAAKWRSGWRTSWTNIRVLICMLHACIRIQYMCACVSVSVVKRQTHWNKDAEKLRMKTTLAAEQSHCPQPC